MFECQGWITIRESYFCDDDPDNRKMSYALEQIWQLLDSRKKEFGTAKTQGLFPVIEDVMNFSITPITQNGITRLIFLGETNHKDNRWNSALEIWNKIAKIAPGSYGLLYFWDDEDMKTETQGYMQVYVMKKGEVILKKDTFLSPTNPEIEMWRIT